MWEMSVQVNVQYVDASCISSEGELTWGAFRKNKHKSLSELMRRKCHALDNLGLISYTLCPFALAESFISVVSLAGLLPEGINDIYFKANNRHMIHPIAAL